MKMKMKMIFIYTVILLSLFGCSKPNEKVDDLDKNTNTNESKQVDDFKVSIDVDENLNTVAAITYIGSEDEKDIYHGGNIFWFNIYKKDGDFIHESSMIQPLLTTTLNQNEPHTVTFNSNEDLDLEKGLYEFEVIADFSLDSNDVSGTKLKIPVSKLQEVK